MASDYLVQEEDGTSKLVLEEGGGFLILEEQGAADTEVPMLALLGVGL